MSWGMNATATRTAIDFDLFHETYAPKIRPEGQLDRIKQAFGLDGEFFAQFEIFRLVLKTTRIEWGDELVMNLMKRGALTDQVDDKDIALLRRLFRDHTRIFREGKFDGAYLDSIEAVALFFVQNDIKTIWIAGAYRDLTARLVDLVIDLRAKNERLPIGHSIKAMTTALSVELNQIQRVFTMFERNVSDSLVKDLSFGGVLTKLPDGRPPEAVLGRNSSFTGAKRC